MTDRTQRVEIRLVILQQSQNSVTPTKPSIMINLLKRQTNLKRVSPVRLW